VAAFVCDPFRAEHAEDVLRLRRTLAGLALLIVAPGPRDAALVVRRALSLGADGVVLERDLERTLVPTVLALAEGQVAVPRAGRRSLQRPQLSHSEKQVLKLAVSGHTSAAIGARLHLAESTVKSHLTSAFRRLGLASRREAAELLLEPDERLGAAMPAGTQVPAAAPASPYLIPDRAEPRPVWIDAAKLTRIEPALQHMPPAAESLAAIPPPSDTRRSAWLPGTERKQGKAPLARAIGYMSVARPARIDDRPLQVQAERIDQFCKRRAWTLVELVHDTELAQRASVHRPAFDYALERLRNGDASCLVVAQLEGLCRSVARLGDFLDRLNQVGARLVCLRPELDTATESGKTVVRGLIAVSDWERGRLAERTRNGLAAARMRRTRSLPAVKDRPDLNRRILAMRASGMSLQGIADALNAEGVRTLRGGAEWRPSSVQSAVGYKRPGRSRPLVQLAARQNGEGNGRPETNGA
jgi:DNA invertase Pin-like site-specific DNA recombinase/DNA-binding CsgD family transcriptional regulator